MISDNIKRAATELGPGFTPKPARKIPESVTGEELCEALQPLLDLLGVRLIDLAVDLRIDFASGVQFTTILPAEAVKVDPDLAPGLGNASSEIAATHTVYVTGPTPRMEHMERSARVLGEVSR